MAQYQDLNMANIYIACLILFETDNEAFSLLDRLNMINHDLFKYKSSLWCYSWRT